jgi:hypothetical protein
MAKLDTRLELRLDKQTYERLECRAATDHLSVAQIVRRAIARELAGDDRSWRGVALEKGLSLQVPVPEDPAELARELDAAHEMPPEVAPGPAPGADLGPGTARRKRRD